MKIRYHLRGSHVYRTTKDFDPNGTPTGRLALAMVIDGKVITGKRLKEELEKPLFPDVPFGIGLPLVRPPKSKFDWVYVESEEEENGTIVLKKEWTEVWVISPEMYLTAMEDFREHLKTYLLVAEEYALPNIPDGDDYIWELMDDTKPYRYRYTEIPVEKDKYNGNFFVLKSGDNEAAYDYLTKAYCQSRTPVEKMTQRVVKL